MICDICGEKAKYAAEQRCLCSSCASVHLVLYGTKVHELPAGASGEQNCIVQLAPDPFDEQFCHVHRHVLADTLCTQCRVFCCPECRHSHDLNSKSLETIAASFPADFKGQNTDQRVVKSFLNGTVLQNDLKVSGLKAKAYKQPQQTLYTRLQKKIDAEYCNDVALLKQSKIQATELFLKTASIKDKQLFENGQIKSLKAAHKTVFKTVFIGSVVLYTKLQPQLFFVKRVDDCVVYGCELRFSSKIYYDSDVETRLEERFIASCLFVKGSIETKVKQMQSNNMCGVLQQALVHTELMSVSTLGSCMQNGLTKNRTLQQQLFVQQLAGFATLDAFLARNESQEGPFHLKPLTAQNFRPGLHVVLRTDQFRSQAKSDYKVDVNGKLYFLGRALSLNQKQLVRVQWYNGVVQTYRAGYEQTFDCFVFDSPDELQQLLDKLSPSKANMCQCSSHLLQMVGMFDPKALGVLQHRSDQMFVQKAGLLLEDPGQFCVLHHKINLGEDLLAQLAMQARKQTSQRFSSYSQIVGFQDPILQLLKSKFSLKQLQKQHQLEFASVPVCASHLRLQKPAVVTIGPDYHSGRRQLGCKFGLTSTVNQDNVYVVWFDKLQAVISDLVRRFCEDYANLLQATQKRQGAECKKIDVNWGRNEQLKGAAYPYEASDQIQELSCYAFPLSKQNFRAGVFVGPGLEWAQPYDAVVGITLARQDEGFWVYWSSGQVTMHRAEEITVVPLEELDLQSFRSAKLE